MSLPDIDTRMKEDILRMWDEGKIKLGQRVPMLKGVINMNTNDAIFNSNFEELLITEDLIKRLRTEKRNNWK